MSDRFTYEFGDRDAKLETFEWERIWWEHIDDPEKPRALIIGDSVSCGYRDILNKLLQGEVYLDGLGTSKAVDNPLFPKLIDYMHSQYQEYDAILFNNGLHGWHLSDDDFEKYYRELLCYVKNCFPDKRLVVMLSTPVRKGKDIAVFDARNDRVIERNRRAILVAKELDAEVLDLYSVLVEHPKLYREDGVHLLEDGYEVLAKHCLEIFKKC